MECLVFLLAATRGILFLMLTPCFDSTEGMGSYQYPLPPGNPAVVHVQESPGKLNAPKLLQHRLNLPEQTYFRWNALYIC
jgi:hypothetical protein